MDKYQFDYIGFQTDNYVTAMKWIQFNNNNFDLHITNLNAIIVYRISPNINSGISRQYNNKDTIYVHTFIKSNVLHIYYMKTI